MPQNKGILIIGYLVFTGLMVGLGLYFKDIDSIKRAFGYVGGSSLVYIGVLTWLYGRNRKNADKKAYQQERKKGN